MCVLERANVHVSLFKHVGVCSPDWLCEGGHHESVESGAHLL